jgi:hypothetical protein
MSKVAKKPIMVLATWPEKSGAQYFGHADYCGYVDGCDSFWLSFRAAMPSDPNYYMDEPARAISDIGLYVWLGDTGSVHAYFSIHEAHNMKLSEAEARIKILRTLDKKMPRLGHRNADSFRPMLMDIFAAIGVTKAIEYRHMVPSKDATFIPVYDAVEKIAKEFDRRYAIIKKPTEQG